MFKVCILLLLLTVANCLICSDKGYEEYLKEYSFKQSISVDYVNYHKDSFTGNCYKLNHKIQNGGIGQVTSLLDWNADELEGLGSLSVRYTGIPSSYEVIDVKEKEYSIQMISREFPELDEYNSPEKKCATSWVTATIELAEMTLGHKVRLSTQQLFECLPKDEDIDGCDGVSMKTLSKYLSETGLVSENDFKDCKSIDPLYTYHFNSMGPEAPTGSALMNLMFDEKKPVLVLVALDLNRLRFVKDMSNMDEGYKCGGYQPSVYGLLTGYKYSGDEDSWWEIRSRVVPGEEITLKLPMSLDMTTANYGGIAAYAFVLKSDDIIERPSEVITETPSTKPVVTESPTQSFATTGIPSERITESPTMIPSMVAPSEIRTESPTIIPSTNVPSGRTTESPTATTPSTIVPTESITESPAIIPSIAVPTERMTETPTIIPYTSIPTERMTGSPTVIPSAVIPSERMTESPTMVPSKFIPAERATDSPTSIPSTIVPTEKTTEISTIIPSTTIPTQRTTEAPTIIPTTTVPSERMTESPTIVPSTNAPTERTTYSPTIIPSTTVPNPTPTPEPWFPIYDPFILGDNTNYEKQETCFDEVISDLAVLDLYLTIRDAYPTKALAHTRVIALSGMTTDALNRLHTSLSKQTLNPAPIDMYFYSDYQIRRYVDATLATPLISLAQYTRPSRIVFADGTFKRDGMRDVLKWMVDNREKGYFLNLTYLQITGHKLATFEGDVEIDIDGVVTGTSDTVKGDALRDEIVGYLETMCTDKLNFPVLNEMNFNQNSYNEYNNIFDYYLRNACSKNATGVRVKAREVSVTIPPMCKTGDDTNYSYYDMEDEKEVAQCRYTWNWEFLKNPKYTTIGPYPNNNTPECDEERPIVPSTTTVVPTEILTERPTAVPSTTVPTERMTQSPTAIPSTTTPTDRITEAPTSIPTTTVPTEIMTEAPTAATPSTVTPTERMEFYR